MTKEDVVPGIPLDWHYQSGAWWLHIDVLTARMERVDPFTWRCCVVDWGVPGEIPMVIDTDHPEIDYMLFDQWHDVHHDDVYAAWTESEPDCDLGEFTAYRYETEMAAVAREKAFRHCEDRMRSTALAGVVAVFSQVEPITLPF